MARRRREYNDVANVQEIRKAVQKALGMYTHEIREQIDEIEEAIAKKAVKKLRIAGSFKSHRAKGYRKTWRAKKRDDMNGWVVHNTTNYSLTHLLEHGHALRDGGRLVGSTRAFPHIKPIESEVIKEFMKEIKGVLEQ